jgi:hypothetical protein
MADWISEKIAKGQTEIPIRGSVQVTANGGLEQNQIVFQHDLKQPCACQTCQTQHRIDEEAHARSLKEEAEAAQKQPIIGSNWRPCPRCKERRPPSFMGSDMCGHCAVKEWPGLPTDRDYVDDHKDDPKPDMVNHPPHYKRGGIETIDVVEAWGLGYRLGNAVKYISRAGHKGHALEDLKKARWYLDREIAKLEGGKP